jgi:4a-hydroxytetrahydrobiopterin dehydratase
VSGHTDDVTASDLLDPTSVTAALADLAPDWSGTPSAMTREIRFADAPTAVKFISELYALCEERDHHADLALSYDTVIATLTTHSAGGVTRQDVELAYDVDRIAAALPLHEESD